MLRRVGCGKQGSADGAGILLCLPLNVLGPVEIKMGEETQQCQSISLSQQKEEPEVRNSSQSGERCSGPRKERCCPGTGPEMGLGTGDLASAASHLQPAVNGNQAQGYSGLTQHLQSALIRTPGPKWPVIVCFYTN